MAKVVKVKQFSDQRGSLTVVEEEVGFPIRRVFFITDVPDNQIRGGHSHIKNRTALICTTGSCQIKVLTKHQEQTYNLNNPTDCLLLGQNEWRQMLEFSKGACLLVLCSEYYSENDYIKEKPSD